METLLLTKHAMEQMQRRCLRKDDVYSAVTYGTQYHIRGFVFYVLRKKDITKARSTGVHINDRLEKLHVVCGKNGYIVTAYIANNLKQVLDKQKISRETIRKKPCL